MRKTASSRPIVACGCALIVWLAVFSATACGADWPQWCGSPSRNPVSAETGLPETFVPGKEAKVLQQIRLKTVYCPPVAANRTLYVATGNTLWAAQAEGPPQTATAADKAEVDLGGK